MGGWITVETELLLIFHPFFILGQRTLPLFLFVPCKFGYEMRMAFYTAHVCKIVESIVQKLIMC
jgi:hypothetical protein